MFVCLCILSSLHLITIFNRIRFQQEALISPPLQYDQKLLHSYLKNLN